MDVIQDHATRFYNMVFNLLRIYKGGLKMLNQKEKYTLNISLNDNLFNNIDIDQYDYIRVLESRINGYLVDNDNYVLLKTSFNNYDLVSYDYDVNKINHALKVLKNSYYYDYFNILRIYDYNTGYLYKDIKGGL